MFSVFLQNRLKLVNELKPTDDHLVGQQSGDMAEKR